MSVNGSDLSLAPVAVHQPVVEDRDPPTRRKMFFFDRLKVLVLLAIFLGLTTSQQKTDIPLMTWGEAFRDQLNAKRWVLILGGLEVLRQIHNIISEHSKGWHQFWQKKVFGVVQCDFFQLDSDLEQRLVDLAEFLEHFRAGLARSV